MNEADVLAVQRAHASGGRPAALAELRRRLQLSDTTLEVALEHILAATVDPPGAYVPRGVPHRDPSGYVRRNRKP